MAGFNIPAEVLNAAEFQKAAEAFISPDGHSVRYLVQTKLNPFSSEAMDQVNAISDIARGAQPNTTLADASISMGGFPAALRDTRDYYEHDIRFIIIATLDRRPVDLDVAAAFDRRTRSISSAPWCFRTSRQSASAC